MGNTGAADSPHQMQRGKAANVNALAGLTIVLMARVIDGMIQSSLGSRGALRVWHPGRRNQPPYRPP